jgi:hypothetical protein
MQNNQFRPKLWLSYRTYAIFDNLTKVKKLHTHTHKHSSFGSQIAHPHCYFWQNAFLSCQNKGRPPLSSQVTPFLQNSIAVWIVWRLITIFVNLRLSLVSINIWTTTTWSNVWVVLRKPSWYEFLIGFLIWTPASKYLHLTTFSNICVILSMFLYLERSQNAEKVPN